MVILNQDKVNYYQTANELAANYSQYNNYTLMEQQTKRRSPLPSKVMEELQKRFPDITKGNLSQRYFKNHLPTVQAVAEIVKELERQQLEAQKLKGLIYNSSIIAPNN